MVLFGAYKNCLAEITSLIVKPLTNKETTMNKLTAALSAMKSTVQTTFVPQSQLIATTIIVGVVATTVGLVGGALLVASNATPDTESLANEE
jgi:hypothetical protein